MIEAKTIPASQLANFIATQGPQAGLFLQSPAWHQFSGVRQEAIDYLGFWQHSEIIGTAVCIVRTLPLGQKYIFVPRGPIIGHLPDKLGILSALARYYQTSGSMFLRIEPPYENIWGQVPDGFLKTTAIEPASTLVTDLSPTAVALLAAMHHKTRYNINLSLKKNLDWQLVGAEGLEDFWRLIKVTAERDKFKTHNYNHYKKILESFGSQPIGPHLAVRLALVKQQSEILAASLIVWFNGVATYLHGASSNGGRELMPTYLLHWQTMLAAKKLGFKYYDWWGINTDKYYLADWQGLTRFKTGFGGSSVNYAGTFDYPYQNSRYLLYKLARRARRSL